MEKVNSKRLIKYWTPLSRIFERLPHEEGRRIWTAVGIVCGFGPAPIQNVDVTDAEIVRLRDVLDKIYNHNEASRASVIKHYGLHHRPHDSKHT